ncbi:prepilin-type N-terminal cleavage/methylation domain-containing protein [Elusimicrobiota bacterium]
MIHGKNSRRRPGERGMSLVELLIAMTILSIGVLAFVSSFRFITRSMHVSRAKTLATNLAQERVENLKNISYYKLAISTQESADNRFSPPIYYDKVNYPIEVVKIGGITYERAAVVYMCTVDDGEISSVQFDYPDTGLKAMTVYVMWRDEGTWKYLSLDNVYENPVVDPLTASAKGMVTVDGTNALEGAVVKVIENPDWTDTTGISGSYTVEATPGVYSLRASSTGHYTQVVTNVNMSSVSVPTVHFELLPIGTGTVTGYAWKNTGLVISMICPATTTAIGDGDTQKVEFVELYNPTTYTIVIGTDTGTKTHHLNYYAENPANDKTDADFNATYFSSHVPAGHYFLIANATFFFWYDGWALTDAAYSGSYLYDGAEYAGALEIVRVHDGEVMDTVGWSDSDDAPPKYEGSPIPNAAVGSSGACGLDAFVSSAPAKVRMWHYVMRVSTPAPSDFSQGIGRAYDSGDNSKDFIYPAQYCLTQPFYWPMILGFPFGTWRYEPTLSGKPVIGANVTADDLMAPTTVAYKVTMSSKIWTLFMMDHDVAYFQLEGVSTGTWTVFVASGLYSQPVADVAVKQGATTTITNVDTDPPWVMSRFRNVFLDTETTKGYVTGIVKDATGDPIENIEVLVGGATKITGANGRYFVSVASGEVTVTANPNNSNTTYVEALTQVAIETGELSTYDFTLTEGGVIMGFISSDGTSILPNIQVSASKAGVQYGLATADASGNFYIRNLTTGTYDIKPILDPMESYSPVSVSTYVTPGLTLHVGTFTVSGAMGSITGRITNTDTNEPITSGALIIVSTGNIPSTPPAIDASVSPAQAVYYCASSLADGTFSVDVRGSTSTTYNLSAFVPVISGATVTLSTKTYSGITVGIDADTDWDIDIP